MSNLTIYNQKTSEIMCSTHMCQSGLEP